MFGSCIIHILCTGCAKIKKNNSGSKRLTAFGLSRGGSGYFTFKQNKNLVATKFKSGRLHEKHVVATWNLGNHLSIAYKHKETKKNLCRGGHSQDFPNTDFFPAVRHLKLKKQTAIPTYTTNTHKITRRYWWHQLLLWKPCIDYGDIKIQTVEGQSDLAEVVITVLIAKFEVLSGVSGVLWAVTLYMWVLYGL